VYRISVITISICGILFIFWNYHTNVQADRTQHWTHEWSKITARTHALMTNDTKTASSTVFTVWRNRCTASMQNDYEKSLRALGSGITTPELQYLAKNFDRCGTAASQGALQKTLLLERQLVHMEQWLRAATFAPIALGTYETELDKWREVHSISVKLQKTQQRLDALQRELISARIDGATVSGPVIQELLTDVTQARRALSDVTVARREALTALEP
jgi:hypothetical protein